MKTKIVPGKPWARFGSRKRDLSAAEPCVAEMAYQELVEPGCKLCISDPEYGGLCADYSALSDDEGLSTTPLLPSCYPNKVLFEFKRAAVPEAVIVTHKSSILGVRDGAVTFPLRTEVSAIAAGALITHVLNVYT
jgi:hypothetical protein